MFNHLKRFFQRGDSAVDASPSEPAVVGFQNIPLLVENVRPAGAIFPLVAPSEVSLVQSLGNGVEAEVAVGVSAIVVRGLEAAAFDDVIALAPETANRALDLVGMQGSRQMSLEGEIGSHATWWHDGHHQVLCLLGRSAINFSMTATGKVTDRDGNVVPPEPAPPVPWHESMRYFRMSQTTSDLFDAFRNVYLALESILSKTTPVRLRPDGRPHEGEGAWLKRALTEVAGRLDLTRHLADSVTPANDGVNEVYDELYTDVRTAIFHAKNGRPVLLPQDLRDRERVSYAKDRYVRLYLELARLEFGTVFATGAISAYAAKKGALGVIDGADISVTSDSSELVGEGLAAVSPRGHSVATFSAAHAPELDEPFVTFHRARARSTDLVALGGVSRFASVAHATGEVYQIERLPGVISTQGFDIVEFILGLRVSNSNTPRTQYLS